MPGKISELVAMGGLAATADLIEAIDISDTSMSPTGTNKRMPLSEMVTFLTANGVASSTVFVGTNNAGLAPNPVTQSGRFLKDDGTWAAVPSSVSAVSGVFPFMYQTSTAETITGSALRGNNATFSASTKIWVAEITVDGLNVAVGMGRIRAGFQIYVQDWADATKYAIFNVTADGIDKGTYWEYNVALSTSGGTIGAGKVAWQQINPAAAGNTVPYTLPTLGVAGILGLPESTANGTNRINLSGPANIASDRTVVFQDAAGTVYVSGGTDVAVADGGTGASTLTGIVKGNGTSAFTASALLAVADGGTGAGTLTGIVKGNGTGAFTATAQLGVADGGTGAGTLTGIVKGNGTGAFTASATVAVADGGTGRNTATTAYGLLAAGTTATGAHQTLAAGALTEILVGGGASALPVWTTTTGTGAPVRASTPTLVTPVLGTPTSGTLTNCTGLPTGGHTMAATARIVGRQTAGAGVAEELTATNVKTLLAIASTDVSGLGSLATKSTIASADITDGTIATVDIGDDQVTYAKLQNVSTNNRVLGLVTGAPANPVEVSGSQLTTMLDVVTTSAKGLVPQLPGTTTTFLNGNGTFSSPTATGGARLTQIYTVPGPLAPGTGVTEFILNLPGDIVNVWTSVTNTFTGSSLIVDVNINGATIFPTQADRPVIPAGNRRDTAAVPTLGAFTAGDRLTVDIDQIGTHAAADQVTVGVEYTYD